MTLPRERAPKAPTLRTYGEACPVTLRKGETAPFIRWTLPRTIPITPAEVALLSGLVLDTLAELAAEDF